ncbi:MAG TPA: CcmD family protein [Limnochordales bacterium]
MWREAARDGGRALGYFVAAYIAVWVLLFAYVALLHRRLARAERLVQRVSQRLQRQPPPPAGSDPGAY